MGRDSMKKLMTEERYRATIGRRGKKNRNMMKEFMDKIYEWIDQTNSVLQNYEIGTYKGQPRKKKVNTRIGFREEKERVRARRPILT